MFEIKRTDPVIPGYTGFLPKTFGVGESNERPKPHGEIPGYAGFVPAVKAENLFGKTYGKLTYVSSAGDHEKGSEIPDNFRYTSMLQDSYVNQRNVTGRTVAEVVGVVPKKTIYTETGPFHCDTQTYNTTMGFNKTGQSESQKIKTWEDSSKLFYGQGLEEKGPLKLGNPIPGYTGVSKRVVADNIFGLTYAEARRQGENSHNNINNDKLNNFRTQSQKIPPIKK